MLKMKLKYEKPLIAVEQYALSQSIAGCPTKVGFDDNACMAKDEDVPELMRDMAKQGLFGEGRGCSELVVGMEFDDNVCYHTNINLLFVS